MLYIQYAQEAAELPGWLLPTLDLAIAGFVIMAFLWYMKWSYARAFSPTKKHRHGQTICTFHPDNGRPYSIVLPIEDNGRSIRAPSTKHPSKTLYYEFDKDAIEYVKYPAAPFLGISLLQSDAPRVSWWENDPNPIRKPQIIGYEKDKDGKLLQNEFKNYLPIYKYPEPLITAERVDEVMDDATLEGGGIIEDEMARQQEVAKRVLLALSKLSPTILYALLIFVLLAAGAAAMFGYQAYKLLQDSGGLM